MSQDSPPLKAIEGVLLDREGNEIPIPGQSRPRKAGPFGGSPFGGDPFGAARSARVRVFGMSPASRILLAILLPVFLLLGIVIVVFMLVGWIVLSLVRAIFSGLR